jgi:hypothetical protein
LAIATDYATQTNFSISFVQSLCFHIAATPARIAFLTEGIKPEDRAIANISVETRSGSLLNRISIDSPSNVIIIVPIPKVQQAGLAIGVLLAEAEGIGIGIRTGTSTPGP